ncbi:hypothetical protein IWZ03DRAFT_377864 [Phyllosticta citriasiana]|uniref:Secreted protein n=1 Tax=Phyllosticta citriasiana TaxID=595635 RepID=A0ABR1KN61_9PEZI
MLQVFFFFSLFFFPFSLAFRVESFQSEISFLSSVAWHCSTLKSRDKQGKRDGRAYSIVSGSHVWRDASGQAVVVVVESKQSS